MRQIKSVSFAIIVGIALSACGSTKQTQPQINTALTANQISVLNDGVDPNAVYDAVDGAKIATVSDKYKNSVHL